MFASLLIAIAATETTDVEAAHAKRGVTMFLMDLHTNVLMGQHVLQPKDLWLCHKVIIQTVLFLLFLPPSMFTCKLVHVPGNSSSFLFS